MNGIYWLASYPKSGNTWLRIFLTNYRQDGDEPAGINTLDGGPIASARSVFDDLAGVEASDLTPDEIDRVRPLVYEQMAATAKEPIFLKVHDAYTLNLDGLPIMSPKATAGVIYLLRNPLDVAVSYAHHSGTTIERMVNRLCKSHSSLDDKPQKLHNQLRQKLLTWSEHVTSWVDESGLPVHIARYEDMLAAPEETFGGIVRFAGFEVDEVRLRKALDFSSFDHLKAQESEVGFKEKAPRAKSFFRKGKTGSWREVLTADQVQQLISAHRDVMRRFRYLTEDDEPVS